MSLQQRRRTNPYPWTWELPAAIGVAVVLALILGIHLGRSLANGLAGTGWTFTDRRDLFTSLPALLGGDATAGLGEPGRMSAGEHALWVSIGAVELAIIASLAWAGVVAMRRWGPARMRGMASVAETEELLGISRLRRNAPIIRPDLHTKIGWLR